MIRVGIVGVGTIAREHAEALKRLRDAAVLVAACDTDSARLAAFADTYGVGLRFADPDALSTAAEVDLVVVATPPAYHEPIVVAALDHGKYVLCEKPLAHSLASAARIAEAASRHPGKLSVSHQLRYQPQFKRLQWLVRNGWLGEVRSATIERHNFLPAGQGGGVEWWGAWDVAGGGVLMTQMIHELDLLMQILGPAKQVSAVADTRFTAIESEDYVEASVRFAGGAVARCIGSVNSGTVNGRFRIDGEAGSASLSALNLFDGDRQRRALAAVDAAIPLRRKTGAGVRALLKRGRAEDETGRLHAELYRGIAEAIAGGQPLPIGASEALPAVELCAAIYNAAITGQPTQLPLSAADATYDGVHSRDYRSRQCDRAAPTAVFVPDAARQLPRSPARRGIEAAKVIAAHVGVEPGHVRALLRRPRHAHGGPVARRWPWPRRRHLDGREIRAATALLRKEALFGDALVYGGAEEAAYCQAFAAYLGGGYADAVNAGSNAVYLALRALDLPPGSEVIVPPATDAGGCMPIAMNLCVPVPADAAPGQVNTSAEQIRAVLTERTSAIVVGHIAGHPVDMDPVLELAAQHGIPVVEDCAQAHGAVYKGRMVGTLGAISAFSTMFGKHHCTGGQGGVVFTRDELLFARAKRAADRGKAFGALGSPGNLVASLNFNQDELSMAIGRVQLAKLPGFLKIRRRFAAMVEAGLQDIDGVSLLKAPEGAESAYLFLLLALDLDRFDCDSAGFAEGLQLEGIDGVYAGYPVHPTDQPWHRDGRVFGESGLPWALNQQSPRAYPLPNARQTNRSVVRIDIHERLGAGEARDLLVAVRKVAAYHRAIQPSQDAASEESHRRPEAAKASVKGAA